MPRPDAVPGSVSERPASGRWTTTSTTASSCWGAVPASASVALDVGCGEGWLVRELSRVVDHVIGLDPDEESVANARGYGPTDGVENIVGDFHTYPFERASFDLITSVAALHHMDEEAALRRLAELLRPSGTLAVVGLGRSRLPADIVWELAGAVTTPAHKMTKSYWETPAPKVWPPLHSYNEPDEEPAAHFSPRGRVCQDHGHWARRSDREPRCVRLLCCRGLRPRRRCCHRLGYPARLHLDVEP
ncbi:MAG: class I SAM-dependent methyltransferase [Acidimicrobiales bacterium]